MMCFNSDHIRNNGYKQTIGKLKPCDAEYPIMLGYMISTKR